MLSIKFLPEFAFVFMMIFARLGTVFMFIPGIGDKIIPMRVRLGLALATVFVMYPLLRGYYLPAPVALEQVMRGLMHELVIGLMIGLSARLSTAAMQTGGVIIAQQMGLGFASSMDPTQREQSLVLTNFMILTGTMMVFAADVHHLAIAAVVRSYDVFSFAGFVQAKDVLALVTLVTTETFRLAVQISAPFLVFGLVFNVGLAVIARVMPALQVFFLAVPLTIMLGFILLFITMGIITTLYVEHITTALQRFMGG